MKQRAETWIAVWRSIIESGAIRGFGLGCSFIPENRPNEWFTLGTDPRSVQLVHLELEHGLERKRTEYNALHVAAVRRSRRTQIGTRGGFQDLFVPALDGKKLCGIVACGPVRVRRPTHEALRAEWRELRGPTALTDEDGFSHYVRAVLESHVFAGPLFDALKAWFEAYAALLAGGNVDRAIAATWTARETLREALPEMGMWPVAADLVTRDRNALWTAGFKGFDRMIERVTRIPTHVVTLLPVARSEEALDAAARLLRVNTLQRAAATFAASRANVLAGRLGEEGTFLLFHAPQTRRALARAHAQALAERFSAFVRARSGFEVSCGVSERALHGGELPDRYDESVVAAKWALSERAAVAFYADVSKSAAHGRPEGLYESSRALCRSFDSGRGRETSVGSERVIKDVMRLTGANLEASRSHFLELLWEVASLVEQRQVVDAMAVSEMRGHATDRVLRARTLRDLCVTFAESIAHFARLLEPPRGVTLRVKLERARRFIVESGFRRPLDFSALAKRVGLSRPYLSRSFKEAYGVGLADFVLAVRLEQSKKLLRETSASITAVSHSAGFSSPSYFHQAFRRAEQLTPQAYRDASAAHMSSL